VVQWFLCSLSVRSRIKHCKFGISCLSTKHAVLRGKKKDQLSRHQANVFKASDISTCELSFGELTL
jgi:hypothetical protein